MDRETAEAVLRTSLDEYRQLSFRDLVRRIGLIDTREVTAADRTRFQLEFQVFWDGASGGDVRVLGAIDDGGLRALKPLTQDFLVSP